MKHAHRPFLFALFLALILVYGVGASRLVKNGFISLTDCAGQCKERYDAMIQRCNELSGTGGERCQSMAQKQYDKCLERCKGGISGQPSGL